MADKKLSDIDAAPPDELGHFRHHFSITFELEHHPLFMATAFIGVLVIIAYLFAHLRPQNTSTTSTPTGTGTASTTPASTGTTVSTPQVYLQYPVTQTPISNHIRNSTGVGWDSNHNGVPYYTNPNNPMVSLIPFGTSISVLASGVSGKNNANNGLYSQISWSGGTGYVASQDVTS